MPTPTDRLNDVVITRNRAAASAEMCVIVLSVHSDPLTVAAIKSVINQQPAAEIVVVNTGRGSLASSFDPPDLDRITLVETPSQQYAGGARNLGIKHSTGRYVAFLAADCLAGPEWVSRRLAAHNAGHRTVASTLRPIGAEPASWATYIFMHFERMPEAAPTSAGMFGLSYDRKLFDELGLFDEQARVGEDSVFNKLCRAKEHTHYWDREIVTLHEYPRTIGASLKDQFQRGKRRSAFASQHLGWSRLHHIAVHGWRLAGLLAACRSRRRLPPGFNRAKLAYLFPLFTAYSLGALSRA